MYGVEKDDFVLFFICFFFYGGSDSLCVHGGDNAPCVDRVWVE